MKPRLTHVGAAATIAVLATGLVGCGSADPAAAAIVDGKVIRETDLWAVMDDLTRVPSNANLAVTDVLPALIQAKVVQEHATELKAPSISTQAIKDQLDAPDASGQRLGPWSPATVEALRDVNVLNAVMQSGNQAKAVELIQKAQVTINPKYGTFDRQRLSLTTANPNWMVATPTQTAEAPAQQPTGNPTTLPGASGTATGGATGGTATSPAASPAASAPATSAPGAAPTTSK